jgi:hypothetical protein
VTWFLLEHGADPELVDEGITLIGYGKGNFLDAVKEWKLMHASDAKQSGDGADHNHEE